MHLTLEEQQILHSALKQSVKINPMDIEHRLQQAIENDVDYADPQLTQTLKDALGEIRRTRSRLAFLTKSLAALTEHSQEIS